MNDFTCDREIRDKLIRDLKSDKNNIKIINELDLHGAVIDIAVINKKYFCGYEIKSDRDTLRRLPIQMQIYDFVLDKITIVIGESKFPGVNRIVPAFWGIIIAHNMDGEIVLQRIRKPKFNKFISKNWLAKKLWKSDIVDILRAKDLYKGRSGLYRHELLKFLLDIITLNELRYYIRKILIKRIY
ncbi:unnamed protein product [marine sediment metagenome]|uniref:Sce7726 family protein n=1 Tax=marine sediment metagenome TaxID=412755 RepID=X1FE68_9ZZZZ